jgi:rhamnosyltransferase subunit B
MERERLAYFFDRKRGPERLLREVVFENTKESFEDMDSAARDADLLVVGECLYTASMVAARRGIPWANVILAPTSLLSAIDPCVLAPAPFLYPFRHLGPWLHQMANAFGRLQTGWWARPYFEFRRTMGFAAGSNPVFDAKHSPHLTMAMFPQFFAGPCRDWPAGTKQFGFPFFQQPLATPVELANFLGSGEPPIVFTLGSIVAHFEPTFYRSACDAAKLLGRRAILLTAGNPDLPEKFPESILAVDYAPLHEILPHAAAVVHAGGIGTCAEALRAGIPSLVIPFSFDQPDNATRMRKLGVAEVLPREAISAEAMAGMLRKLLDDPAAGQAARSLAARINPTLTLTHAIEALEALLPA